MACHLCISKLRLRARKIMRFSHGAKARALRGRSPVRNAAAVLKAHLAASSGQNFTGEKWCLEALIGAERL